MTLAHAYVHVPFCARRCSYCDFSIAVRTVTPVDEYLAALKLELAQHDTSTWQLKTLYFGGGTPSRLGPLGLSQAIDLFRSHAQLDPNLELTVEANPDDITPETAQLWAKAGINRVSLGVQTFNSDVLQWMHRTHSADQAKHAVDALRSANINNISVDLIFALPPELKRNWNADVETALTLNPDHISLYGLTVEAHTPLARWKERGDIHEAEDDTYEEDFLFAHESLTANGFEHYEVSNYAKPNRRSQHNSSYWLNVPYAGLGPSAHSFFGTERSWNIAPYTQWAKALNQGQTATEGSELLTEENRNAERVYLGLRTSTGLLATDAEVDVAKSWVAAGWATICERTVVLTPLGWLRLDALAASLTAIESR